MSEPKTVSDLAREVTTYVAQLQAENAKLRNEVDNLLDFEHLTSVAVAYAGCDECGEYKQTMLRLFAENDKLRELVRDMMRYYFMPSAINSNQRERELLERAHELGVEEDNGELGMEVDK